MPMFVKLDGIKAQKVRLDDLASFGDADFVGLSKVQVFASLGPQAVWPSPADGDVVGEPNPPALLSSPRR